MKRLIVHADDLGLSQDGNDGIFESHLKGIVTSASLLANGVALEDALRRLPPTLDLGLHLDLSEGRPLVRGHRTLVRTDGCFHGKVDARRLALQGAFDPREVEQETLAQIDHLRDKGVSLTHLDGHQHLHVYGPVASPIARAARERGLRWVRLPAESAAFPTPADDRRHLARIYAELSKTARQIYETAGLRSADTFAGSSLSGFWTCEHLKAFLDSLRSGSTELMLHPGTRDNERRLLLQEQLPALLQERGIQLAHFGNL